MRGAAAPDLAGAPPLAGIHVRPGLSEVFVGRAPGRPLVRAAVVGGALEAGAVLVRAKWLGPRLDFALVDVERDLPAGLRALDLLGDLRPELPLAALASRVAQDLAPRLLAHAVALLGCEFTAAAGHLVASRLVPAGELRALARFVAAAGLSWCQAVVLQEALAGQSAKGTAAALGGSHRTVETHWRRIFDKTGLRSRPAVLEAIRSS